MNLVRPEFRVLHMPEPIYLCKEIEHIGRVCYKSEDKTTEESAMPFVEGRMKDGHDVLLEFHDITVKFWTDRGVSHELVRHRMASFVQESTRYVNYKNKEMCFVSPLFEDQDNFTHWSDFCVESEEKYLAMLAWGNTPQVARSILPTCLATTIIMKANLREWRHVFKLRCAPSAHPQMRELMTPLLVYLKKLYPVVFDDIMPTFDSQAAGLIRDKHEQWIKQ